MFYSLIIFSLVLPDICEGAGMDEYTHWCYWYQRRLVQIFFLWWYWDEENLLKYVVVILHKFPCLIINFKIIYHAALFYTISVYPCTHTYTHMHACTHLHIHIYINTHYSKAHMQPQHIHVQTWSQIPQFTQPCTDTYI